jgi:hypothetical protein
MKGLDIFEILIEALDSPYGIIVATNDPERLKQKLYAEMKKDEMFKALSCCTSRTNPGGEVWIVKKGQPDAERP